MNIGQRVREAREALGMQRTVLARRVGVAENTIYRIETAKRTPSVELLEKIARELRTEPAEFLRDPALAGKAEAPPAGPSLLDKALGAARRDAQLDAQAIARLFASEGKPQSVTSYEEDKFRAELRTLGFPDEHFEDFVWPLVELAAKTKQLEEQLAACEEERRLLEKRV
jgi:transcriptional regulator with XRE-family HTH domain